MLDDAVKALSQMLSPPLRAVLWKSIGLALALIVVVAIALDRLIVWLVGAGSTSVEHGLGPQAHMPAAALAWLLSDRRRTGHHRRQRDADAGGDGFRRQFLCRQIADEVEREYYPADPPGTALPLWLALLEGGRTALLAVVVYHRRRAASDIRRLRRRGLLSCDGLAAGTRIFRSGRDALSAAARGQGVAQAQCRNRLHRRTFNRGFRLDPDCQFGDAAVRHEPYGARA